MALELTTDGDAQTFTAGEAGYKYGNTNTSTVGAVYGFCTFMLGVYAGFVNIVTGVSIDMKLAVNISLFYGYRFQYQGGKCTTVSAIQETNVKNDVTKLIVDLEENIISRNQIIETSINVISTLNESGITRTTVYNEEETVGETSTEEWSISKSITSASYSLNCEEGAMISVDGNGMMVTPSGVDIIGPLIELN